MTHLDISFSLFSQQPLPADHGYLIYSAVSGLLPEMHRENGFAIHPIAGTQIGDRQMKLTDRSRLTIRVPDGQIAPLLKLAGQSLRVGPALVQVGVPEVRPLVPVTSLRSRLVVIKIAHHDGGSITPDVFTASARKQLDALEIDAEVELTPGRKRTLCVKQREIVGYEVLLEHLTADESIRVQESGLGGKRHMGAGVFVPYSRETSK
ncbi:type I-MYXAN CRISPR-associated protein Cas6/Cmx6 [Rubinisphaera margarita]|uniref:type I-MYXAN CRISPR-associated protein Cas6/Cmx6 n=1 Tax=Rubinisphaera margarita TaxID=2909586 RepID=UPI001EE7EA21|nr:type I-MYXAN CRISPR-associated protein Cas6/Cmx6 [Rubinisphaera margarita]MCG6157252.1 type I-MYXAN CRISPR-associated protein Cas6/Cmx6 [Rubinisphaera margarita]